jgi:hypothetical protein
MNLAPPSSASQESMNKEQRWPYLAAEFLFRSVHQLLVTPSVVPRPPIVVTLMKEALRSSEPLFLQEPRGVTSQKTPFFVLFLFI